MIGSIVLSFIPGINKLHVLLVLVLSEVLFLIVPSIIYLIVTKSPVKKTLKLNWPGWLTILLAFLFGLFIQPAMMFLSALTGLFFPNDVSELINTLMSTPTLLLVAAVALTPAICEEIPLRGILLSGYDQIDIKKAMLINGLFFAMIHFDFQQSLYTFVLGAIFAYIVRITNSIIPTMVAHFTINASQIFLQKLIHYAMQLTPELNIEAIAQEYSLIEELYALAGIFVFAVIVTPVAIIILYGLKGLNKDVHRNNKLIQTDSLTQTNNLVENENIIQADILETTDNNSKIKIFNWPVWLSIVVYFAFTTFLLLLSHVN